MPLFMLDQNFYNLNSGGRGTAALAAGEAKIKYMRNVEMNPDQWFRTYAEPAMNQTLKVIAKYLKSSTDSIVFIENASDGFNAIIKSFQWKKGDKILYTNVAYPMVQAVIRFIKDLYDVELIQIQMTKEDFQSDENILKRFQSEVDKIPGDIKFASIDHISSGPPIIFPIKQIADILHKKNAKVCVDGAHVVGMMDIDLSSLGVDFYFSNFHKWAHVVKNAAFLWVKENYTSMIHPNIMSFNYQQGLVKEFYWTGTRDYSTYLSVKDALDFRAVFGESEIFQYERDLGWAGGNLMAKIWNTEMFINNKTMNSAMIGVRMPKKDANFNSKVIETLHQSYNISISSFIFENITYARVCAQIFNEINDFKLAAEQYLIVASDLENQEKQQK